VETTGAARRARCREGDDIHIHNSTVGQPGDSVAAATLQSAASQTVACAQHAPALSRGPTESTLGNALINYFSHVSNDAHSITGRDTAIERAQLEAQHTAAADVSSFIYMGDYEHPDPQCPRREAFSACSRSGEYTT